MKQGNIKSPEIRETRKIKFLGYFVGLLGLLIIFAVLYFEHVGGAHADINQDTNRFESAIKLIYDFGRDLGIAFLSIGFIYIILEMRDWQKYFQARLADVVIDHIYLKRLSSDQLKDLQVRTWKALHGEDIARAGGFLGYFEERIRKLIGDPYRERVDESMFVSYCDNNTCFLYETEINYTCPRVRGQLQPDVKWAPEKDEFIDDNIENVEIELEIPIFDQDESKPSVIKVEGIHPAREAQTRVTLHRRKRNRVSLTLLGISAHFRERTSLSSRPTIENTPSHMHFSRDTIMSLEAIGSSRFP